MKRHNLFYFFIAFALFSCENKKALFSQLPVGKTGISFSNRITDSDSLSILTFEYIYNGGGVGMGDFNNDGLTDVYFTGNQVSNRLYLNKGKFTFDDITQKSNTTGGGKWCAGVAVVDINNDGLLDMYVCATAKVNSKDRENLLYVNKGNDKNGVPVFEEKADEYGIADTTHSTNAAFFDYDNDGDLDLYILVDKVEPTPNKFHVKITDGTAETTGRLYRNDWSDSLKHPYYTNVSKEAGIQIEGYGLGLNITDINRDGWKDIYVTNDYLTNDLLYINNQNKTFTNQADSSFKHTCYSAMGNDVSDINNDGLADIIALDMLPEDNFRKKMFLPDNRYSFYQLIDEYHYQHQYGRNVLQLNQGPQPKNPVFSEIGLLAGVSETDWSWCPMVVDFDNDSYRDVIITNGFPKDVTDHDFISYRMEVGRLAPKSMLLEQIPVVKIKNYAFKNKGDLKFENVTDHWGIENPSFSNGAAYADLDNDGDLDYIVNNINDSAFVYQNNLISGELKSEDEANYLRIKFKGNGKNPMGLGAIVELSYNNGKKQVYEHSPYRGYLSTVEQIAHFGLGKTQKIDEVKIIWQTGKVQILKEVNTNQVLEVDIKNANENQVEKQDIRSAFFQDISENIGINYKQEEKDFIDFNIQKLLPHKFSQFGPSVSVGDVNGDGLDDLFLGGAAHKKGKLFIQETNGSFKELKIFEDITEEAKIEEDSGTLLFDADSDGDLDLYIVSGSNEQAPGSFNYQDRLYINQKGTFKLDKQAIPEMRDKSGFVIKAADYDKDGDLDLFLGCRLLLEKYPSPATSFIYRNDSKPGKVKFTDVTKIISPQLEKVGLVSDALWTDYDNDGWIDLVLAGEWMPITFLKNESGKFKTRNLESGISDKIGWWNSLVSGDFDSDGDLDYVAGNLGLNTLNRADDEHPVRTYFSDFNKDGNFDAIPSVYFKNEKGVLEEFPFFGRDDMNKQLITFRKKFTDYKSFAKTPMSKVFSEEEAKEAKMISANWLKTTYIENLGKGNFKLHELPLEVQFAPIFGMLADDFNGDNNSDVLLVGNDFGCEVSQGRMDALNGIYLEGDGKGGFIVKKMQESGIFVPGDAKGLVKLINSKGDYLAIATQNRNSLKVYKNNKKPKSIRLQPNDAFATLKYKDGKSRREEFYYGNSFLSQSSRVLNLNENVTEVEITDFTGKKRIVK